VVDRRPAAGAAPAARPTVISLHRVCGPLRLSRLLQGYRVAESAFLRKADDVSWSECAEREALDETPSERYYAIGLFVLTAE
jgi:hypothetical protein